MFIFSLFSKVNSKPLFPGIIISKTIKSNLITEILFFASSAFFAVVIKKLKITKQSLNRILKDLIKIESIIFEKGKKDTRLKHIYLSKTGQKLFNEIFSIQKKRIYKALLNSSSKEVLYFDNVIKKIINEKI